MELIRVLRLASKSVLQGGLYYRLWVLLLLSLIAWGGAAYFEQFRTGLIVTAMRDQVSWAYYIGNFTFLVGVAAAAVTLVVPAYVYKWEPIKEVAILGEILAISAIVMCMLFVVVDMGRPDRAWHLIPFVGHMNFPHSVLAWDVLVLNMYLILNVVIVGHVLFTGIQGRHYNKRLIIPLVLFSVPAAISIHTVTAFLYAGLSGRPFWNASILAPRFIASAFCSGPAILLILFQILQRTAGLRIKDEAMEKIAELMAYFMFLNLFLLGAEVFKEYYWATEHQVHFEYLFSGVHGHNALVPFSTAFVVCGISAFVLFLIPKTRHNMVTRNIGCLLIYVSVYLEKGLGLVIPGMTPDELGEIYEYRPTWTELRVGAGIFSVGFLVFTLLTKIAIPIMHGEYVRLARVEQEKAGSAAPTPAS